MWIWPTAGAPPASDGAELARAADAAATADARLGIAE
jgi:hypothetical protein